MKTLLTALLIALFACQSSTEPPPEQLFVGEWLMESVLMNGNEVRLECDGEIMFRRTLNGNLTGELTTYEGRDCGGNTGPFTGTLMDGGLVIAVLNPAGCAPPWSPMLGDVVDGEMAVEGAWRVYCPQGSYSQHLKFTGVEQ